MANTTTHTGSFGVTSDPTSAFSSKGSQAKVLSKTGDTKNITSVPAAGNLSKETPIAEFPLPTKTA